MRTTSDTMTENIPVNSPITLKHFYTIFGTMLALLLICGLFAYYILTRPIPPIPSGEIIDQFGTYVTPSNKRIATIGLNEKGKFSIKISENRSSKVLPYTVSFQSGDDWLATWSDNDDFWHYSKSTGKLRLMYYTADGGVRMTLAGIYDGWDGIPESFLEKLPKSEIEKYETWKNNQE